MGKRIIVYTDHLIYVNGLYTWILNFCRELHTEYEITLLSKRYSDKIKFELSKYVTVEPYSFDAEYETDTVIYNFDFTVIPNNIKAKNNYTILHCDYSQVKGEVLINPNTKYIAVSEHAKQGFMQKYNVPCDTVESILPNTKPNKILHLISCTRMIEHKGAERIYQLAYEFDKKGIRYLWLNFSDKDIMNLKFIKDHNNPSIIQMPPVSNRVLRDYINDADYLVQLSDHEGYCFAVHEALSLSTPVITTDIPIFKDLVIDGFNGYKVPLDMTNIDVEKIARWIPVGFNAYKQDIEKIKSKWVELLD